MFCPSCGAPNLDNAVKCVSCQRLLPKLNEVVPPDKQATTELPSNNPNPGNFNGFNTYPPSQAGVSSYTNASLPYSVPVDQAGVSNYGYPNRPNSYPPLGVSNYANNPTSYSSPVDRVGVSNYGPAGYVNYGVPADRVGVGVGGNNFWPRVGAYLIDQIISSIILGIVFGIPLVVWLGGFFSKYSTELANGCGTSGNGTYNRVDCNNLLQNIFITRGELGSLLAVSISTFVLGLFLMLAYQVILTARGQTLGKKVFGLRVVKADGSVPGFGTALLRQTIGYFISNLFFGLGFLWVAFESNNRGWHDMIAGTYVVPA